MVEPTRVNFRTKQLLTSDDDIEIPRIEQVAIETGSDIVIVGCDERIVADIKFVMKYPDICSEATGRAEAILNALAEVKRTEELLRKIELTRARMYNASLASLCATLEKSLKELWEPQQVYFLSLATEFGERMIAIREYQMNHGSML